MQPLARLFLTFTCGLLLTTPVFANPAAEIARAVTVNGVSDVSAAQPRQFLAAFTAVAMRVPTRNLPGYVSAAINLRPSLAPDVVAVAVKAAVKNCEGKPETLHIIIDRIVQAAIAANPNAAVSIARAGASAVPALRECVMNAAVAAAPQLKDEIIEATTTRPFSFLTFSAPDNAGLSFGTGALSANIFDIGGTGAIASPEQPPSN